MWPSGLKNSPFFNSGLKDLLTERILASLELSSLKASISEPQTSVAFGKQDSVYQFRKASSGKERSVSALFRALFGPQVGYRRRYSPRNRL